MLNLSLHVYLESNGCSSSRSSGFSTDGYEKGDDLHGMVGWLVGWFSWLLSSAISTSSAPLGTFWTKPFTPGWFFGWFPPMVRSLDTMLVSACKWNVDFSAQIYFHNIDFVDMLGEILFASFLPNVHFVMKTCNFFRVLFSKNCWIVRSKICPFFPLFQHWTPAWLNSPTNAKSDRYKGICGRKLVKPA